MPLHTPTVLAWYRCHQALRGLLPRMPFRYTVRFGTHGMTPNRVQINLPEAIRNSSDKKLMKECFERSGVKTAKWQADGWDSLSFPIVAKHRLGSRGTGVYRLETNQDASEFLAGLRQRRPPCSPSAFIYEQFKGYKREYRLHVTEEGCFHACRKLRTERTQERWKFSDGTVWVLEGNPAFKRPSNWAEIEAECVKALKAVGLDFGAVDVKVARDGRFFILEINSAPGLEDGTLAAYVSMLPRLAQKKWNVLNPPREREIADDEYSSSAGYGGWGHDE